MQPKYIVQVLKSGEYVVQNSRTMTVIAGPYGTHEQALKVAANLNG